MGGEEILFLAVKLCCACVIYAPCLGMTLFFRARCILLVLAAVSCATGAMAQAQESYAYWNVSHTVDAGAYDGAGKTTVVIVGGVPAESGAKGGFYVHDQESAPQAVFAEKCLVTDAKFTLAHASLSSKSSTFKNCTFILSQGGALKMEGCVLENCTFFMGSAGDGRVEDQRAVLNLKNCVLISPDMGMVPTVGANLFQWDACTFYLSPIHALFTFERPAEGLRAAQGVGSSIRSCQFKDGVVSAELLALSDASLLVNCAVTRQSLDPLVAPGQKLRVSVSIKPAESFATAMQSLPEIEFTPAVLDTAGASLPHEVKEGALVSGLPEPGGSVLPLSAVIPPTRAVGAPPPAPAMTNVNPPMPGAAGMGMVGNTVAGTEGAANISLKQRQSFTNGLMIVQLDQGEAGSASKMTAIALEGEAQKPSVVGFNQQVGEMMTKALAEVCKFTQLRQKGWPKGFNIEISFADKYSGKDGPSAAVACALLLNSLITGTANDPEFAITGDMNADGSVQPIGGVAAKIRGATNGRCKVVAIPARNEKSLGDLLLTDGPLPFASIQIYSVSTYDQAEVLARKDRPVEVATAMLEMSRVQEVLLRNNAQLGTWLRNPHVLAKLHEISQAAPDNLSAKYLLMYASGQVPQYLSLTGSLEALEYAASSMVAMIMANKGQGASALKKETVGSSITQLQILRSKCDVRVRPYADSIIRFGLVVKDAQDQPPRSPQRITAVGKAIGDAAEAVTLERQNLMNNPQFIEELEK